MADREPKAWITVNGVHIPLFDGQSKEDAVKEHFGRQAKHDSDSKEKQIAKQKEVADKKNSEKETPKYEDADDFNDFIKKNIKLLRTSHKSMDEIKQDWYATRQSEEVKSLKEIDPEDAINTITDNIKGSWLSGWFRNADSSYKPRIMESVFGNSGTLNAALNLAYYNYQWGFGRYSELYGKWIWNDESKKPLSFKEWLNTPMTMYRGTHGQKTVDSDVFSSYTPDRRMAEKFGKDIDTIQIKPIDTWGSYQTTVEGEYLIPARWLEMRNK